MGQRIDVNHENIYYGDFLAVEDVNINIEANKVTAFIGPSGCGKSTVLRTLDRMHEIIPGAHCEGEVLLEGKNLYDKDVDPVAVRRDVGMVFQRPNPFVPIAAIVMCVGALVLVICDPSQRSTLLTMIPFVALCYTGYYASVAWRAKRHGGQDDAQNVLQSVPQDVSQPHREDGQED